MVEPTIPASVEDRPRAARQRAQTAADPAANVFASPSVHAVLRAVRDSCTDLAQNRDPEMVAQSIVQRTRHLLAADMAYISLNDLAAGETFIRWTDGVRTEAYKTIRMPLGTGVLGMIAAGQPLAYTGQYVGDPEMIHVPRIDAIVAAEGVRTVTGVPLRISGRVAGALLVASRTPTTLTPRGRFAIEQLAAQASIALLQQRSRDELEQLHSLVDADDRSQAARAQELQGALELDDRLLETLARASDPADAVAVLAEQLDRPVGLWSARGDLLAGTELPGLTRDTANQWRVDGAARASIGAHEPATLRLDHTDFAVMGLAVDDTHIATLIVESGSDNAVRLLRRGADFVMAALIMQRVTLEADRRARSMLIEDILATRTGPAPLALPKRLAQHGLNLGRPVAAYCVEGRASARPKLYRVLSEALAAERGVISPHETHVCVLANTADPAAFGRKVTAALAAGGVTDVVGFAVVSGATTAADLAAAHDQALTAARAATALGFGEGVFDATALGVAGLLLSGADPAVTDSLIQRFLGAMLQYDDAHGSQLTETAWQFFENAQQLGPTAARLHVHPNTVKQRLGRIDKVQGPGWRVGAHAVDTHFALRLWHAREALAGGTE
ncbi:MAG: helix-turn-helix domain-containing protein [Propionibacteriaceae bacterium]|jgi:sugar diacid utilization regulator/GAF domain-containing protein|nr:helix-turn-helix domain-containing protein [Propionibacteriaceae bacterium]